jgi:hypothetical protein
MRVGREATPGVLSTTAVLGMQNGPLGTYLPGPLTTLAVSSGGPPWAAASPGVGIPTLTREFEPTYNKHQSPIQTGRRFGEVSLVQARRETQGQFSTEVLPDSFGQLLFLLFGVDVVTPAASGTLTGAGNTANTATLTVSATGANTTVGQRAYINDGALSEYVNLTATTSGVTSIPITGGGGTGGGLKNSHVATTPIQYGPWTHVFSPSNAAAGIPTFTIEDNWGGITNSLIYTACSLASMEFNAPIENDTEALTAIFKVIGLAPVNPLGVAGSGGMLLPIEEVPCAAGNAATLTATGATLPSAPFNNIYVPDFKMTVDNSAKLIKASAGSPDPYTSVVTNFTAHGTAETIFEAYNTFADYYNLNIWNPATFVWTWGTKALQGAAGALSASLTITIQRFGITKANKPQMKDDIIRLPIESWAAQDYPDFGGTNGPVMTMTLVNDVAVY